MAPPENPENHMQQKTDKFEDDALRPLVSVVLPVFEEAETIRRLVLNIVETLMAEEVSFEIIAVDDGSKDNTLQVLKELKREYSNDLHVVRHLYNKGNGSALRTGTRIARGEIVVNMDSDGQHSASDIPALIELIPPYDLVIGTRTKAYEGSWYRNAANRFYNRFASWLSATVVEDLTSGFRAMRRSVVQHFLPLYPAGFSAPTTITLAFLKAGYNVAFVPINVQPRAAGRSKIRLWDDGMRFMIIILRMIMLYEPLRIFLPVGMGLVTLGIAAWVAGLINAGRLVLPNSAIFLFIAALITWLLGLVSNQIAGSQIQYQGDETIVMDDDISLLDIE
jgi:glycosyltransferase involved in cell wall biosynthesis